MSSVTKHFSNMYHIEGRACTVDGKDAKVLATIEYEEEYKSFKDQIIIEIDEDVVTNAFRSKYSETKHELINKFGQAKEDKLYFMLSYQEANLKEFPTMKRNEEELE